MGKKKNKSTRNRSTVKKTVIVKLLKTAPLLPYFTMPAETALTHINLFRGEYLDFLRKLQEAVS